MNKISSLFQEFKKTKFFKHALPFFLTVGLGSLFLREFASLRYEFSKSEKISPADFEELKKVTGGKLHTLEEEYEKLKKVDLDNWENKRIPRPYEE